MPARQRGDRRAVRRAAGLSPAAAGAPEGRGGSGAQPDRPRSACGCRRRPFCQTQKRRQGAVNGLQASRLRPLAQVGFQTTSWLRHRPNAGRDRLGRRRIIEHHRAAPPPIDTPHPCHNRADALAARRVGCEDSALPRIAGRGGRPAAPAPDSAPRSALEL